MEFEQEYIRCVRNEEECVCSVPNCCDMEQWSASQPAYRYHISGKIIKEMPGLVASGTHCKIGTFHIWELIESPVLSYLCLRNNLQYLSH
jgi:hypothetical protein